MSGNKIETIREKLQNLEIELNDLFIERYEAVRGLILALLSRTNILFLGTPGTAKSMMVKEFAKHVSGANYFEWLLSRYSTPDELFGPISAKGLMEDHYRRLVTGKLPEAHFAFLDEIFKANTGILNALLSLANERIFYNDGKPEQSSLLCLVGASNEVPEDSDNLDALFDRFHLKYKVDPIQETSEFLRMLELNETNGIPKNIIQIEELKLAQTDIYTVELSKGMFEMFSKVRKSLDSNGIKVSDRTYKIAVRITRAEAWLRGSKIVEEGDFEILKHLFWQDPDKIKKVHSTIIDLTNPERNKIEEIFNSCVKMSNDIVKLTDKTKRRDEGFDALTKLRTARDNMSKHIKTMSKKGKDTKAMTELVEKVNKLTSDLMKKAVGMDLTLDGV